MKKSLVVLTIVILVFSFSSCELLMFFLENAEVTIQDRLASFEDKLDSFDRSDVWEDTHPDSEMYDQQTNETWDYYFPTDYLPYSIDYVEPTAGTEAGTMVMETEVSYTVYSESTTTPITITFLEDGEDFWYIYRIDLEVSGTMTNIFRKIDL